METNFVDGHCDAQLCDNRKKQFVKSCWNCKYCSEDPDGELDGTFCFMDGMQVYPSIVCSDWKLDGQAGQWMGLIL